jgi:hypothetical protein
MNLFSKTKGPGATLAGIFGLALASVVLLCGAGSVPVENFTPQGAMQADLNAGGHSLTNVATLSATNVTVSGSLTAANLGSAATNAASAFAPASGSANYVQTSALGSGVATALGNAANAAGGVVVSDSSNSVRHLAAQGIGPSGISIMHIGDSTTYGLVSDPRQTYPCISSTLGFALNGCFDYNFGFSGYTTYSVNALYSTNENITKWTGGTLASATVSTCPATVGGTNNYAIVYLGTNDYFGVYLNATLNGTTTITGLSRINYFTDFAGHPRPIAVGDAVTGTGIPANTTVASIVSGSSITLSNAATVSGTQLLTFTPSPTTSTFHTDLANLIANCKSSGYKTIVCTLPPANDTATPADGVDAQGLFQANRLVYNTYIRSLTYNGAGSNPDALCDLASLPDFQTFNANLYNADMLHPNYNGNCVIAVALNAALLNFVTPSYYRYFQGSEALPDTSLSNNVALYSVGGVFAAPLTVGQVTGTAYPLNIFGNLNMASSAANTSGGDEAINISGLTTGNHARLNFGYGNGSLANPTWHVDGLNTGGFSIYNDATNLSGLFISSNNTITLTGPTYGGGSTLTITGGGVATSQPLTAPTLIASSSGVQSTSTVSSTGVSLGYFLAPNQIAGTGNNCYLALGVAASNYNSGGVVFNYAGAGSSANSLGLGVYGFPSALSVFANGHVALGSITDDGTNTLQITGGGVALKTAGYTLSLKGGSNAASGTITLVAGTGTITSTAITASDVVFLSQKTAGGTAGTYTPLTAVSTGTIVVTGLATDTSTYNWAAIHANQ